MEYIDAYRHHNSDSFKKDSENYEYPEFRSKWVEYLTRCHGDAKFITGDKVLFAKDFPIKNINFSVEYGFITLKLNSSIESLRRLRDKEKFTLQKRI